MAFSTVRVICVSLCIYFQVLPPIVSVPVDTLGAVEPVEIPLVVALYILELADT